MNEANDMTSTAPLLRALRGGRGREEAGERAATRSGAALGERAGTPAGAALGEIARAPAGAALGEIEISRAAVRAGDRHEPWTLPASPALRALAEAALAAGIELELALRLCLERALVVADLRAVGVEVARLDSLAARACVSGALDAADCAYLRRLTRREDAGSARPLGDAIIVGLPSRLTARLLAAGPEELLERAGLDVEAALSWEIAAVLDGRTISEWAPLAALRVRAA